MNDPVPTVIVIDFDAEADTDLPQVLAAIDGVMGKKAKGLYVAIREDRQAIIDVFGKVSDG